MTARISHCLAVIGLLGVAPINAAELKVLAAEVVEPAVKELAAQFEKTSGHTFKIEYGFGVEQNKRIQDGEQVDVVIGPNGQVRSAPTQAKLMPDSTRPLLRIGQGVAVKKNAAKPDVSSPEAFKAALVKARSVAFVPTGQSGIATLKIFETLGIAEDMKAKTKAVKVEDIVSTVAKGEAELALFLNNYLVGNPQVDYVGPYPGDLQSYIVFSAGVGGKASNAEAAQGFVKFLSSPAAAPLIKAHGMEPG
jgi:molybdate transport system substrate-binding protein